MSILKVHSIESFSTLDGPGIRYVIFLQGCSFRCHYCHNIDTRAFDQGKELSHSDIIWEVRRNAGYLKANSGGITASGGEPLEQAESLVPLFREVKGLSLTTCLDTAGYILNNSVKKLLDVTDLVLLDYKHTDEEKHKILTGRSNRVVKEFHRYLEESGKNYWIRYTILQGINDSEDDISGLKEILDKCHYLKKIDVLPYHTLGVHKWRELNMDYPLGDMKPFDPKRAREIQDFLSPW
ncbi:MAG: pyruvate formate lyase-activating protein [Spirochaetales bacterium]|nr:pyruvate formate lyase-activating protein [Spirochaetales bacterium]